MAFMTFRPESSSVIKFLGYDTKKSALAVQFNSGTVWVYLDVDLEVYDQLISSKSVGQYFNLHIRNVYQGQKMFSPHEQIGDSVG